MKHNEHLISDLRELVQPHLGKPLAVSTYAGVWHCPASPHERHALLIVSADEYRCLSGYPCANGATEWVTEQMEMIELIAVGEIL